MTKKLVDNKIAPNKAEYDKKFSHILDVTPYHGAVTLLKTMALVCEELKLLR
ncbi:hypothetical protein REIS_1793 [Rickettsia endosymbiont of Ixodes scapularis]|nr:hypothetical protein REIS_1793 [Rickettsia endosymbiont of Ixodes scapularis]